MGTSFPADMLPMIGRASTLMLAFLMLGGCLLRKEATAVAFDAAAHRAFAEKGTARLKGEGFLRRPNAYLARCSGGYVYLLPDTPYFRDYVRIRSTGARVEDDAGTKLAFDTAVRRTQCNMNGRFEFGELPAAKWIVALRISYSGEAWSNESSLVNYVETRAGETAEVVLSNPNGI